MLVLFLAGTATTAQEWTKEQLEVWNTSQTMWEKWKTKDMVGAYANIHDSYRGWGNESPLPISKQKWMDQEKPLMDMISDISYDYEPARIVVVGDAAVIHYYFSYSYMITKDDEKKWISRKGKNTEFYIRDKGEWMLVGDFTYRMEKDDD